MPDNHANFATSTVATAPSPALSGLSLTVASGHGARFPAAPFNCSVWPVSVQPLPSNAEIVRVTAVVGDVLTITRAQEGSTARAILVGDQIALTITKKVLTDIEALALGGDVVGPASAVTARLASFSGTTGKLLQDSGFTAASLVASVLPINLASQVTGDLPLSNLAPSSAASRLLGRRAASAGDFEEISLGNSLALTTTVLDAIQDIRTSASPTFAGLTLNNGGAAGIIAAAGGTNVGITLDPLGIGSVDIEGSSTGSGAAGATTGHILRLKCNDSGNALVGKYVTYFDRLGGLCTQSYALISGNYTDNGNGAVTINSPSSESWMLAIWSDVIAPALQIRNSDGNNDTARPLDILSADGGHVLSIRNTGKLTWGSNTQTYAQQDANLYRYKAAGLQTDSDFLAGGTNGIILSTNTDAGLIRSSTGNIGFTNGDAATVYWRIGTAGINWIAGTQQVILSGSNWDVDAGNGVNYFGTTSSWDQVFRTANASRAAILRGSPTFNLATAGVFGWSTTSSPLVTPGTGLSCISAGLVGVGTGAQGSFAGSLKFTNIVGQAGYTEMAEMTAPAAPGANLVRIYAVDNGSGKTQLMARFPSGAAQQLAIEP